MAFTIHLPKNLDDIEERVFGRFTKRQCVCFGLSAALAFPLYVVLKDLLNIDVALFVLLAVTFPIMYAGWYKKDGKRLEEVILLNYRHKLWQYQFRKKSIKKGKKDGK